MLSFRVLVPGVAEYTGMFPGQLQAALDAEHRYPDAPPACTFVLARPAAAQPAHCSTAAARVNRTPEQHFAPSVPSGNPREADDLSDDTGLLIGQGIALIVFAISLAICACL